MQLDIRSTGSYKVVQAVSGNTIINLGLLDNEEQKTLAINLLDAIVDLMLTQYNNDIDKLQEFIMEHI